MPTLSLPRRFLPRSPAVRHLLGAALAMVVVVVLLTLVDDFRRFQLAELAALGIAAGGLTVLTGLNGQLSLGHGALMAVGAWTTALLLPDREATTPVALVILASVAVTALLGAVVGVAAARLHGPYLAGATLALAVAVPSLALHFRSTLGGEQGLRVVLPEAPSWAVEATWFLTATDLTTRGWVAFVAWTTLVLTYLVLANLASGRVGRRWRAVRDDEVAAQLAGISPGRARVSAFTVSAAAAGAGGAVLALVVRLAAPGSFTIALSLTLLAAVVLGGLGTLTGALLGASVLVLLPQVVTQLGRAGGLDDVRAAELAPLVHGLVLVAVVLWAPAGLTGSVRAAAHRRRARRALAARPGGAPPPEAATAAPDPTPQTPAPAQGGTTPPETPRPATSTQGAPR
ncbi:branched-chain amino acid ABC transporter permease [Nocardioides sp. Y6]|uniref:Branched-chain amino acid ABC transporter permease n=1 Tax=Nocardioides malaquae TaxID=2773426 RepID=A0ABR9RQL5_9ACTN|nr:branched-chain amino acid ABC transporter permease [Nocardioides malaquae]MBE7323869.1 branched-chain amino acid ABC transporter permease [Nocardioides malaquae]